jgi:putative tryptophan/tyrosine transport system substrate-binding protein
VLYEAIGSGITQYNAIDGNKGSLTIKPIDLQSVNSDADLDAAVAPFAKGGLIVTSGAKIASIRDSIIAVADKYKIPTVYPNRLYVAPRGAEKAGLVSFGADLLDLYRLAGVYLGGILNNAKLPDHEYFRTKVPTNSRFEVAINTTTAAALGSAIDQNGLAWVLARADWVYK